MDRAELQQISQMIELYHQKIAQIEEQITKLDQVIQEHETTNRSLKQLIKGEVKEGLIPIGAGIQIPIQYSNVNFPEVSLFAITRLLLLDARPKSINLCQLWLLCKLAHMEIVTWLPPKFVSINWAY